MTEIVDFALQTARQAGEVLRKYYHQRHTVQHKSSDIDLVTEADLASERFIIETIRERFPEHSILSEEGVGAASDPSPSETDPQEITKGREYLWLVDPLDGTVNYAHGYPAWGVSLALAKRGKVIMGVVYDPLRDEIFWAERGRGAWLGATQIYVSETENLHDALVATGFAYKRATLADNNLAEFGVVMPRVQGVRRAGAAVLDLAHLAAGRLDGYWEMHLQPWDWAAGALLVEEAGGAVSDIRGKPWLLERNTLVASNGLLHTELLTVLEKARRS